MKMMKYATETRDKRYEINNVKSIIFLMPVKASHTNILIYIYIHILITIKVSKKTKVTSQALYKKNIEIKEKKKKLNESSDDF